MSRPARHVGIVGAGVAGLALAALLARDGWRVTVLERTADLGPVGAGFMLQHLGQQVMYRLGAGDELLAASAPIRRVDGRTGGGLRTMQFAYDDAVPGAMAWGVHRGDLFTLLHRTALDAGAVVVPDCDVQSVVARGAGWSVLDRERRVHGPFDLLVGADGATSRVRELVFPTRLDRPYPWGALWAIVPDPARLTGDALVQRWHGTGVTLGLMPTGGNRTSIFWSVRMRDAAAQLARGPQAFVDLAAPLAGELAPLVEATAATGLLAARYRDVVVRSVVGDRSVLIGDAAHAMSPQLGTGASMGLADAWTLAWALRQEQDLRSALAEHARQRRRHVAYYRWWSMLMTPVFQSGLTPIGPPRDVALLVGSRSSFVRAQMVGMLMGTRSSPWGTWALPA